MSLCKLSSGRDRWFVSRCLKSCSRLINLSSPGSATCLPCANLDKAAVTCSATEITECKATFMVEPVSTKTCVCAEEGAVRDTGVLTLSRRSACMTHTHPRAACSPHDLHYGTHRRAPRQVGSLHTFRRASSRLHR